MWQGQKKMAQHLLGNYQLGRRDDEAREDKSTRHERGRGMEEARKTECNLRANTTRGETKEKMENRWKNGAKSLCKVVAMRVEGAGREDK